MTDMSALRKFRSDAKEEPPAVEEAVEKTRFEGVILAFDQTVGHAGWVRADLHNGHITFPWTGNLRTEQQVEGRGDLLIRGQDIYVKALDVMMSMTPDLVLVEEPPMGGRLPGAGLSSLVAATSIACAAQQRQVRFAWVHGRHAKKVVTGNGSADKQLVKTALLGQYPQLSHAKPWNEHVADAVALVVTYLHDGGV